MYSSPRHHHMCNVYNICYANVCCAVLCVYVLNPDSLACNVAGGRDESPSPAVAVPWRVAAAAAEQGASPGPPAARAHRADWQHGSGTLAGQSPRQVDPCHSTLLCSSCAVLCSTCALYGDEQPALRLRLPFLTSLPIGGVPVTCLTAVYSTAVCVWSWEVARVMNERHVM